MKRMDEKFNTMTLSPDSVYQMEVDKTIYDISDPEYVQIHCLRFEFDRGQAGKNQSKQHGVKITDIDYYLDGNRHTRAQSEQFIKG